MMRLKSVLVSLALFAFGFCSCEKIHEFPRQGEETDPTEIETRISVECKVQLSGISVTTKAGGVDLDSDELASMYNRRFIINMYSKEPSDSLVESVTVYREVSDTSDFLIDTRLQAKKYKLIVWMDYVRKGEGTDLFYLTSEGMRLDAIHLPAAEDYTACSDFKDAQTFTSDVDLTPYAGQWFADITIPAPLERPVAKITILANDLEEYASRIGYTGSVSELAEDISLEFAYNGFYPSGFNAHTGRLNDSQPGYGFKCVASFPYLFEQKKYARLGYDYMFVNGESSSVTVTVRIKSKSGDIIKEVNNVVVPITRGKETVLVLDFLTGKYVPGIGINPEFDGEYNVYV